MRKRVDRKIFVLIVVVLLVGFTGFVLAYPILDSGISDNLLEDESPAYTYNFSDNVSGSIQGDMVFSIAAISSSNLLHNGFAVGDYYWVDINSSTGIMNLSSVNDNETGLLNISVQVLDESTQGTTVASFFTVNATNDLPTFSLNTNYSVSVSQDENESYNISLSGSDEEGQYPLSYNVSFNNCSFASWSTRTDGVDCDLGYDILELSDTNSVFAFDNLSHNDIGSYNLTFCVTDNLEGGGLPLYRDSNYDENKTFCLNTTMTLYSSLYINATDCDGSSWTEGEDLTCWINITTVGATDLVDVSTNGIFKNDAGSVHNSSWFYGDSTETAADNLIAILINVSSLSKEEVGNWTINISADDGVLVGDPPRPVKESFSIFVNYTESPVSLSAAPDFTGASALYESQNFQVTGTDDDLLIWDNSVKKEILVFASNETWVAVSSSNSGDSLYNYRTANVYINHTEVLELYGEGNYSVRLNVTDGAGNSDEDVFVVEVYNDTAPEWDLSLDNPLLINLTEDVAFSYNFSMNVSDLEGDSIEFYYDDLSGDFYSLNSTNFNSVTGVFSFTPIDSDVGFHNVSIIATDGKLNSTHQFDFNVSNVLDNPVIVSAPGDEVAAEATSSQIQFYVDDEDFLIPSTQSNFYDENISVDVSFENLTVITTLINFSFESLGMLDSDTEIFEASFTPDEENVGYYNVTINVTDAGGLSSVSYFTLNISRINDLPNLSYVENQETTILRTFYLDVNATDEEDGNDTGGLLNFSLYNLTAGGDFLVINPTTGIINLTMNESLAGFYEYNLTVNDSEGGVDWQLFNLTVYGVPNVTLPVENYVFNWTENVLNSTEFKVNNSVNNTNLTYVFYVDRIVYSDAVNFSYSNLTLRDSQEWIWNSTSNFSWDFTPDYSDETYGMLKNMTLLVYNTEYPELNSTINYKLNITHVNENVSFSGYITDKSGYVGTPIVVNLSQYFEDVDHFDEYYSQAVNFTIVTSNESSTNYIELGSSFNDWILSLSSVTATTEIISVVAHEYDNGTEIWNATSNDFEVQFVAPSGGSGTTTSGTTTSTRTTTELKHFSLKIVTPQDVILNDNNYIEVPFSLQNTGAVDLVGINLDSVVRYNNQFSDDVKVVLQDTYVPSLAVGEIQNYTLKITANTQRSGDYKVTVNANITSPKFSDWGEFFIKLEKTNESEAEQLLLFTEKFVSENPECIELMEIVNRAGDAFSAGDIDSTLSFIEEATIACENAISANEQIRYSARSFIERNFYWMSFIFLGLFVVGMAFYIYKRVRFNKYKGDYY